MHLPGSSSFFRRSVKPVGSSFRICFSHAAIGAVMLCRSSRSRKVWHLLCILEPNRVRWHHEARAGAQFPPRRLGQSPHFVGSAFLQLLSFLNQTLVFKLACTEPFHQHLPFQYHNQGGALDSVLKAKPAVPTALCPASHGSVSSTQPHCTHGCWTPSFSHRPRLSAWCSTPYFCRSSRGWLLV